MRAVAISQRSRHEVVFRALIVLAVVAALAVSSVNAALAQDSDRVQLGIKPIGVDGSYFDLTMEPGESRQLTVELGNFGTQDAVAMTYPADVYSLVNGGMGIRLAGEPTSGATEWIGFEAETMPLHPAEAQLRSFAVSVPDGTAPGEYITSVVIQDATPVVEASGSGVVANRVNRQAIAVAITVPGPIALGLVLGGVEHHVSGGRSVITVDVTNSGNVRLQPSGELVVTSVSGGDSARFQVQMESVYAGTSTVAEIPFTTLLEPGAYTIVLSLEDSTHSVTATTTALDLAVPVAGISASAPLSSMNQAASASQPVRSSTRLSSSTLVFTSIIAGGLALALAAFVVTKRWLPRTEALLVPAPAVSSNQASSFGMARPIAIRQLYVPRRHHEQPAEEQPKPAEPRFRKLAASGPHPELVSTAISNMSKGI